MRLDLSGQRFGRLAVLSVAPRQANGDTAWACMCDCGSATVCTTTNLRRGASKSCGCLALDMLRDRASVMNLRHGLSRSPTYVAWMAMRQRCENPKATKYEKYGAVGIMVCERWHTFDNFLVDMGVRPAGMTIDRFPDNRGNYEPGNCRWATPGEQQDNRSITVWVDLPDGRRVSLVAAAREFGLERSTLRARLARNVPTEMLFAPVRKPSTKGGATP